MKAIVDADTNQILGAAVLGVEGGELMSMLEIAMMGKLPYTGLRDAIFAHPHLGRVAEQFVRADRRRQTRRRLIRLIIATNSAEPTMDQTTGKCMPATVSANSSGK
jgi:hypothetical protein